MEYGLGRTQMSGEPFGVRGDLGEELCVACDKVLGGFPVAPHGLVGELAAEDVLRSAARPEDLGAGRGVLPQRGGDEPERQGDGRLVVLDDRQQGVGGRTGLVHLGEEAPQPGPLPVTQRAVGARSFG